MFTDWNQKPGDGLEMLEDAPWPAGIKAGIVAAYAKYSDDITGRKLVEPTGEAFKDNDGNIQWGLVVDYFAWEAASLHSGEDSESLQNEATKKWGFRFSHYPVYDSSRGY